MLRRLQQKWNVTGIRFVLILVVFAITGTTTAWLSRMITGWVGFDEHTHWASKLSLRLLVLIFGYQAILLLVAFIFGQFSFFWNYEKKILRRMRMIKGAPPVKGTEHEQGLPVVKSEPFEIKGEHRNPVKRLAIFASGAGSNAARIIDHFRNATEVKISLIVCNKPEAGVVRIAEKENIPVLLLEKERFFRGDAYLAELGAKKIDFIILAGFLWKIPAALITAYPRKIINLHPALLPAYGGKGMYGSFVHRAVIDAGEKQSGITIHYVDEHYDHGDIIFQQQCPVHPGDTPENLAERIHALEHRFFPGVIEQVINKS